MTESLIFEFNPGAAHAPAPTDPGQPMRILVMGDFSGRASRGLDDGAGLATRAIHRIDIDNLERAPARLSCALELAPDGPDCTPVHIDFCQLDDFLPDRLYRKPELFEAVAGLRTRLDDPASFDQAAAQLGAGLAPPRAGTAATAHQADSPFAQLLGGDMRRPAVAHAAPTASDQDGLAAFVRSVVGPITVADPRRAHAVAALDALSGERMRALLHDPAFRRLEAAWRSLALLITSVQLDEQLQVHLLDVSKRELLADLPGSGGDLSAAAMYRLLVEQPRQSPDSHPWSLLVADYRFDNGAADTAALAALGAIAAQAGAPVLAAPAAGAAGAGPQCAADGDSAARWSALRRSAQARWIGLATPDLLLRLPYGSKTDRIESFDFEELRALPTHDDYLWGNPAFGCALLLARSFGQSGWDMRADDQLDIDDLPAHTWQRDGEAQLQACGGVHLSERAGAAILQQGPMPLLSFKNRNAVRLLRFQSIADPLQALAGPWQD